MAVKVSLDISDKAYKKLTDCSEQLGLSPNQFVSICLEYVDIKHQGIQAAVKKFQVVSAAPRPKIKKEELEQHLQKLSEAQIELLLLKAAKKRKN